MRQTGLTEPEAVIAVARRGNFRLAAVDLGMSPSALSHAVASLEGRLGSRLFNRTTRSVSLSAAGEQFVGQVAPALGEIRDAMEAVDSQRATPAGSLRVSTSPSAAVREILTPLIIEYLRRYPEMAVDIVTEGRLIDIVAEGFDAGIRLAEIVPRDMIAVSLGPRLSSAVVGAPKYFVDNPPPQTPADLIYHRCIRMRMPSGAIHRWEFEKHGEQMDVEVSGRLTLDEHTLIYEAARAGLGLAYVSHWSVTEDLAGGPPRARFGGLDALLSGIAPVLSRAPACAGGIARAYRSHPGGTIRCSYASLTRIPARASQ